MSLSLSCRSSSQFSEERGPTRSWGGLKQSGALLKTPGSSSLPGARRRAGQEGAGEHGGRTSEQGKDYLVELDGDLLR